MASLKAILPPIATDVIVALCMCVSSVALVHPAKLVGRSEVPFGREGHSRGPN